MRRFEVRFVRRAVAKFRAKNPGAASLVVLGRYRRMRNLPVPADWYAFLVKVDRRQVDVRSFGSPGPKVVALAAGRHTIEVRNMRTTVFESHVDVHDSSGSWLLYVKPPFRKSQSLNIRVWPLGWPPPASSSAEPSPDHALHGDASPSFSLCAGVGQRGVVGAVVGVRKERTPGPAWWLLLVSHSLEVGWRPTDGTCSRFWSMGTRGACITSFVVGRAESS
jgi:hypothetical protein